MNKQALDMGELIQFPTKPETAAPVIARVIARPTESKNSALVTALCYLTIAAITLANTAGMGILGLEITANPLGGTIFALIGTMTEIGTVIAYRHHTNTLTKLALHTFSAACILFGLAHIVANNETANTNASIEQAARAAEAQELRQKLTTADDLQKIIDDLNTEINNEKNTKAKGGTIWTTSNGCTQNNHPRDCGKIAAHTAQRDTAQTKLDGIDTAKITARLDEIYLVSPETRLKQENNAAPQLDNDSISRIKAVIAPEMSATHWKLSIFLAVAAILQILSHLSNKPFEPRENSGKTETSRNKNETRTQISAGKTFFKLFSYPDKLLTYGVETYAKSKAWHDHKAAQRTKEMTEAAQNAVADLPAYLNKIGSERVAFILDKKSLLPLKTEKRERAKNIATWLLQTAVAGERIQLEPVTDAIKTAHAAEWVNPTAVRQILLMLEKAGFITNEGTDQRGIRHWATTEQLINALKGN